MLFSFFLIWYVKGPLRKWATKMCDLSVLTSGSMPQSFLYIFFIFIYLQHAPLHGNTPCSSIHIVFACSFGQLLTLSLRVLYFYVLVFI